MKTTERFCRFCQQKFTPEMIYVTSAVCAACGQTTDLRGPSRAKYVLAAGLFIAAFLLTFFFKNSLIAFISPSTAMRNMTESEVTSLLRDCQIKNNKNCLVSGYRRLVELDPPNVLYQANLAFHLTASKNYQEADSIYRQILAGGTGTYDLMAGYADNFEGLGQRTEAIKWYEKSLEINPNLIDVAQKLARAYVKEGRVFEAVSLLRSFIDRFPEVEGELSGDISADLDLLARHPNHGEKLKLVGLSRGHFGLPLELGDSKAKVFLMDTGATFVTVSTKEAQELFPELMNSAVPAKGKLADGRVIASFKVRLPSIRLGQWEFKNVDVVYCDSCQRLAGMSLLKHMKTVISSKGEFYSVELSR